MSAVILTSPPIAVPRLVVDTDVASFLFKWRPEFAPVYARLVRGAELILSFMTVAEMREGALEANWGQRKLDVLEAYLDEFTILDSFDGRCSTWASIRRESESKGRSISVADAWIASAAVALSAPLMTDNSKDFLQLEGLTLITAG